MTIKCDLEFMKNFHKQFAIYLEEPRCRQKDRRNKLWMIRCALIVFRNTLVVSYLQGIILLQIIMTWKEQNLCIYCRLQ